MSTIKTILINFVALLGVTSALSIQRPDPAADLPIEIPTITLSVEIPIDRAFDMQWNPPGHPQLEASLLDVPWGDRGDCHWGCLEDDHRDGHYTFEPNVNDGSMSFVRRKEDGIYFKIFKRVEFLLLSEDVLMFNGDPHEGSGFPAGGGYGTLIKGRNIAAGPDSGVWDTKLLEEGELGTATAIEWLLENFGEDHISEDTIDTPDIPPLPIINSTVPVSEDTIDAPDIPPLPIINSTVPDLDYVYVCAGYNNMTASAAIWGTAVGGLVLVGCVIALIVRKRRLKAKAAVPEPSDNNGSKDIEKCDDGEETDCNLSTDDV